MGIVTHAANNRNVPKPIFRAGDGGPSLRCAVTALRVAGDRAKGPAASSAMDLGPACSALADAPLRGLSATRFGRAMGPHCPPKTGSLMCAVACLGWHERSGGAMAGAQPQASTRRSAPLTPAQRPSLMARVQGAFTPAPLPFGENGVPRGSASWSRPQAAKQVQLSTQSLAASGHPGGTSRPSDRPPVPVAPRACAPGQDAPVPLRARQACTAV